MIRSFMASCEKWQGDDKLCGVRCAMSSETITETPRFQTTKTETSDLKRVVSETINLKEGVSGHMKGVRFTSHAI